jgi:hypothetical protein
MKFVRLSRFESSFVVLGKSLNCSVKCGGLLHSLKTTVRTTEMTPI